MLRIFGLIAALILPHAAMAWKGGGNEPFWSVHIAAGEMRLTRPGEADRVLPIIATETGGHGQTVITTTAPAQGLRAVLTRHAVICHDTMTGMPYPETIELVMAGEHVSGCGGAPLALLTGRTWLVEEIDGAGLVDAARVTLGFGSDGRVVGAGGCNRWFAGFDLTGEGLHIGPAGATMMACAPAVMDQERRFFEMLAEVTGFSLDDSGALLLLAGDAPVITARSATDGSAP